MPLRPGRESLQTRVTRKMSPRRLQQLPSPLLHKPKEELATHIQRTFRNNPNFVHINRKGEKMTTNAMRRQLLKHYLYDSNNVDRFINGIVKNSLWYVRFVDRQKYTEKDRIKFLINNFNRPLLIKVYDYAYDTEDKEETLAHLNNPIFFPQNTQAHGKKSKKKLKKHKRSKKHKRTKKSKRTKKHKRSKKNKI